MKVHGVVVGWWIGPPVSNQVNTESRGYVWTLATGPQPIITDPNTVNKFPLYTAINDPSAALRINTTGAIAGVGCPQGCGTSDTKAAIWTSGQGLVFLGSFDSGVQASAAGGLNNVDQVVGHSWGGGYNNFGPFIWSAGNGLQPLTGFSGLNGTALGINSHGEVVGSKGTGSRNVAFVWSASAGQTDIADLPGTTTSGGLAINDSGVVVGIASIDPDNHTVVFRWSAATGTEDLNAPAGYVELLDINNDGDIVATISPPAGVGRVPYLYHNGSWTNLNDLLPSGSGFTLQFVEAINNHGWIVGAGTTAAPTELAQGFVLIPPNSEGNHPPVLGAIGNRTVKEGSVLTFIANGTDPDVSSNTLSFSLDPGAPTGATINSTTGGFSWTPSNKQGPTGKQALVNYPVTVRVTDNGSPALSDSETITITVTKKGGKPQ